MKIDHPDDPMGRWLANVEDKGKGRVMPSESVLAKASEIVTDWCVQFDAGTDESGLLPGALQGLEDRIALALSAREAAVWEEAAKHISPYGDIPLVASFIKAFRARAPARRET